MLLQAVLLLVLVRGLAPAVSARVAHELTTFGILLPPPAPPPLPPVSKSTSHAASGKAAPPAKRAQATEVVAPVRTMQPPPVIAAPVAGVGVAAHQGAAPVAGPGSGAGGEGNGTGSGDDGEGEGAGGTPAQWLSGEIRDHDYPHYAFVERKAGTVHLRFTIGVDGRVSDCAVTKSSGVDELDEVTCKLIVKRFRYRPARNARGEPVPTVITGAHVWEIATPPAEPDDAP